MGSTDAPVAGIRIAVEGCGHGTLHDIYAEVGKRCESRGWDGVDALIVGGDFQAVRNGLDMNCMHVPVKYRAIGDFQEYYSGARVAPYLTIFVGGNHEASNHNFELFYGGWVAPNIYYMGAANVLRLGPLRIAGMSGIWKGYDYRKPHYERLPYNQDDITSIYHIREIDVRKLRQVRTQVDVGISHDWPHAIEEHGNRQQLFYYKPHLEEDSLSGKLGSQAARSILNHLRPLHWFSAHLHARFEATLHHSENAEPSPKSVSLPNDGTHEGPPNIEADNASTENVAPAVQLGGETVSMSRDGDKTDLDMDDEEVAPLTEATVPESASADVNGSIVPLRLASDRATEQAQNVERPLKRRRTGTPPEVKVDVAGPFPNTTKNEDELDLDLDDDDSNSASLKPAATSAIPANEKNARPQGSGDASVMQASAYVQDGPEERVNDQKQDATPKTSAGVVDDLRALLPDSFRKHNPGTRGSKPESVTHEPDPPTEIRNSVTHFLALSKCAPKQKFLDVLEIPLSDVVSPQSEGTLQPPFKLEYDPEWLAITRVFAAADDNHILLGNPSIPTPSDRGRAHYLPLVEREEAWVQKNIVKSGRLVVPENFVLTAPVYDKDAQVKLDEMPREYSNPQTEAFCDLIQIPNPFKLSEEQAERRIEIGPRPNSAYSQARLDRGRGGGRGGVGRERGGGRGSRGARGGRRGRW